MAATTNKNPIALVEAARHALGRALVRPLLDARKGELKVVTLDIAIEEECMRAANLQPGQMLSGGLQVSVARKVLDSLRAMFGDGRRGGTAGSAVRLAGTVLSEAPDGAVLPRIVVIAPTEIPPMTLVQSVGVVR